MCSNCFAKANEASFPVPTARIRPLTAQICPIFAPLLKNYRRLFYLVEECQKRRWLWVGKVFGARGQKLQLVATNCFRCRHFGALWIARRGRQCGEGSGLGTGESGGQPKIDTSIKFIRLHVQVQLAVVGIFHFPPD